MPKSHRKHGLCYYFKSISTREKGSYYSPYLFNILLEVLATTSIKNRSRQINCKKDMNLLLFANNIVVWR